MQGSDLRGAVFSRSVMYKASLAGRCAHAGFSLRPLRCRFFHLQFDELRAFARLALLIGRARSAPRGSMAAATQPTPCSTTWSSGAQTSGCARFLRSPAPTHAWPKPSTTALRCRNARLRLHTPEADPFARASVFGCSERHRRGRELCAVRPGRGGRDRGGFH